MTPESYMKFSNEKLISAINNQKIAESASFIHTQFRSLVLSSPFPCSGAKTAFSQGTYRFGLFDAMGEEPTNSQLAHALKTFVSDRPTIGKNFSTFIACFKNSSPSSQMHFTDLLWEQLQQLHNLDESAWDPHVNADPNSSSFSFSFAGCSFFVIGMHAGSPRWARRFAWPALVFNAHDQFEQLRSKGDFEKFKNLVRKRDFALQGSSNPILEDHGLSSEALQYSGGIPDKNWVCPFKAKQNLLNTGV
jgi:hypothetical protein